MLETGADWTVTGVNVFRGARLMGCVCRCGERLDGGAGRVRPGSCGTITDFAAVGTAL
jgi:hypothetical protein